jgi:exopolysaccharide biosynthesis polyprenyl glycosylphosphotransferase
MMMTTMQTNLKHIVGETKQLISMRTHPHILHSSLQNSRHIAVLLLLGDGLITFLFLRGIYLIRFGERVEILNPFLWGAASIISLILYIFNLHRPSLQSSMSGIVGRTLVACFMAGVILVGFSYLTGMWQTNPVFWRGTLIPFLACFSIWGLASRLTVWHITQSSAKEVCYLLLGCNADSIQFEHDIREWNKRAKLIKLVDNEVKPDASGICSMQFFEDSDDSDDFIILDSLENFLELSSEFRSFLGIIVGPNISLSEQLCQKLMQLRFQGIPVYDLKNFYKTLWHKFPPNLLQDTWFAFGQGFGLVSDRTTQKVKLVTDLIFAALLLLALSPLMIATALAIKIDSPGPIFYSQWRTGLHGEPFRIYKFRSMAQDAEKYGAQWAKTKDPRITRVGYWLRLLRIDELPQLLNVLRGEMSFIGPRPERPEFDCELDKQIPYYSLRYLVKPGITGWAQVIYPYGASVKDAYEKLSYDLYYIRNYSIWLDLFIILKTIRVVVMGKGR